MNLILPFLLNRYVLGGLAIFAVAAAVFFAGDRYGFNARKYAACKVETARRNAAISAVNKDETALHAKEEAKRKLQDKAFSSCKGMQQCILTAATADCLNIIRE